MNLLSIPAYLFFHLTWLLHSLRRPFFLVSALCILSNPGAAIRKCKLFYLSFLYLAFSKDKKFKVPKDKDPASFFPMEFGGTAASGAAKYREKTIILIRHGESTWWVFLNFVGRVEYFISISKQQFKLPCSHFNGLITQNWNL